MARDEWLKSARRNTNVEIALPNSGQTVPYRNTKIVNQNRRTFDSLIPPALADGGVNQPSQTPAVSQDQGRGALARSRQAARTGIDITQDKTGLTDMSLRNPAVDNQRVTARTGISPRRAQNAGRSGAEIREVQKTVDRLAAENNRVNPMQPTVGGFLSYLGDRSLVDLAQTPVLESYDPNATSPSVAGFVRRAIDVFSPSSPEKEANPIKEDPRVVRTDGPGGKVSYSAGPNNSATYTPSRPVLGSGATPARTNDGQVPGRPAPGQLGYAGSLDTYGDMDLSGMSPEEKIKAKVAYNDRVTDYMRETRKMFTPKQQPWGADQVGRSRALREYREELSKVLRDSKNRKLTAKGTANALQGLRDYYGEALGLSPKEQGEQDNLNYRAELAAQQGQTADKPFKRYEFDVDDEGNTRVFDAVTGAVDTRRSDQITMLLDQFQTLPESASEEVRKQLKDRLAAAGYDVEKLQ